MQAADIRLMLTVQREICAKRLSVWLYQLNCNDYKKIMSFSHRIATLDDALAIESLMALSMSVLLKDVLSPEQVAKSNESMGLDTQIIKDGTYFLILDDAQLVGCGGWSRRRTLYGGNHTLGRDNSLADPANEAAKIRAMYTHPDHVRRGIGKLLIDLGEEAATAEGFKTMELGATASGILLYEKCGYEVIEDLAEPDEDGVTVPIILMRKSLVRFKACPDGSVMLA